MYFNIKKKKRKRLSGKHLKYRVTICKKKKKNCIHTTLYKIKEKKKKCIIK